MGYDKQADFGTPASTADATVTLSIDGRRITVAQGTSVMRAASEAGGAIPKLCATDMVKAFGSCRLCLVVELQDVLAAGKAVIMRGLPVGNARNC